MRHRLKRTIEKEPNVSRSPVSVSTGINTYKSNSIMTAYNLHWHKTGGIPTAEYSRYDLYFTVSIYHDSQWLVAFAGRSAIVGGCIA